LAATGLTLHPVPPASVLEAGRSIPADAVDDLSLGRWQPDLVAVSQQFRKIAIIDLCRPSDTVVDQLDAAHDRKLRAYSPLLTALQQYVTDGWIVEILPWVVSIGGLVHVRGAQRALKFLAIPVEKCASLLQAVAVASVQAFHFMHRVRLAAQDPRKIRPGLRRGVGVPRKERVPTRPSRPQQCAKATSDHCGDKQCAIFDTDDPDRPCTGKRTRCDQSNLDEIKMRWDLMTRNMRQRLDPQGPAPKCNNS